MSLAFPKPEPRVRVPKRIRRRVTLGAKRAAVKAVSTLDEFQRQTILDDQSGACAYCCVSKATTFDHVVPIAKGGKDEAANVVGACLECNLSKGTNRWKPLLRHRWLAAEPTRSASGS